DEPGEAELIQREGILNIDTGRFRRDNHQAILDVETRLHDCDVVVINLDLDALDAVYAQGTGTPEDGGLTPDELNYVARELIKIFGSKVHAIEVTEMDPVLDRERNGRTLQYAVDLTRQVQQALVSVNQ